MTDAAVSPGARATRVPLDFHRKSTGFGEALLANLLALGAAGGLYAAAHEAPGRFEALTQPHGAAVTLTRLAFMAAGVWALEGARRQRLAEDRGPWFLRAVGALALLSFAVPPMPAALAAVLALLLGVVVPFAGWLIPPARRGLVRAGVVAPPPSLCGGYLVAAAAFLASPDESVPGLTAFQTWTVGLIALSLSLLASAVIRARQFPEGDPPRPPRLSGIIPLGATAAGIGTLTALYHWGG